MRRRTKFPAMLAIGLCFSFAAMAAPVEVFAPPFVRACETCHGRFGNSRRSRVPRINGQIAHYIVRRLNQLGQAPAPSEDGPYTKAHDRTMSDQVKAQIAAYFAEMPPTPPDYQAVSSLGVKIYFQGSPSRHIAPCAYCHGGHGEGNGPIPRLAGQHKAYLKVRLDMLSGFILPGSGAMHIAVQRLTPAEIDAVASYLAAQ